MTQPKSIHESRLLIANTIAETVLSFQINGDETESELKDILENTEDFVEQLLDSIQFEVKNNHEKFGIFSRLDLLDPAEFIIIE